MIVENQVKAGSAGGVETVVKVINTHIGNANACAQGCGTLWNMIAGNGKNAGKVINKATPKRANEINEQLGTK